MSVTSTNLDQELESIIKAGRKKKNVGASKKTQPSQNRPKINKNLAATRRLIKGQGNRSDRAPIKSVGRVTKQRNAVARNTSAARSQAINKARGIQSSAAPKTALKRRPAVANNRANSIVRRALLRTQQQRAARQPRTSQRTSQRAQPSRAYNNNNNNNGAAQSKNLRITFSNRSGQGARNGGVISNRLRGAGSIRTSRQTTLRRNTFGTTGRSILTRTRSTVTRRTSVGSRLNNRRAPIQTAQYQVNARLTRVRQNNQVRQASVVAQRRGIVMGNNSNNRNNNNNRNNARSTLDARFSSQQRRVNQGGRQQGRPASYRNNNNNSNNNSNNNNNGGYNRNRGNQSRFNTGGRRRRQPW